MKTKPQFILFCREALLEEKTNNLSLIEIFSEVIGNRFPFALPSFVLVVNFDVDIGGPHTLHTTVRNSDGGQVARANVPVQTHAGNWQVIAHFEQLQVPAPGTYAFQVTLEDQLLGERKLEVKAGPPSTTTPEVV